MNTYDLDLILSVMREMYRREIGKVYKREFQMKLVSVMYYNEEQYKAELKIIETISSIIESAFSSRSPKRMLRYIVMLRIAVEKLEHQTESDFQNKWADRLTTIPQAL